MNLTVVISQQNLYVKGIRIFQHNFELKIKLIIDCEYKINEKNVAAFFLENNVKDKKENK